jgi:hypothetical protein
MRLQRRVVVFPVGRSYFGFAGALMPAVNPRANARPLHRPICATKPSRGGKLNRQQQKMSVFVHESLKPDI